MLGQALNVGTTCNRAHFVGLMYFVVEFDQGLGLDLDVNVNVYVE